MTRLAAVLAATAAFTATASAHHSPAAFDLNSQITIQGRVARLEWSNPHVYIYVDSDAGTGTPAQWMIETDPVPILTRSGWHREQVAVGSTVTVRANPDRNSQRTHGLLVSIAVGNGVVLTPRAPAAPITVKASSVAGVWNGLRGFTQRRVGPFKPTARGQAALEAYTEGANPITNCVPYVSPFLPTLPYLSEISVQKDRVIIRSEFLNVDRTVWMDGRAHPAGGPRTNQGHSIGRWDGDVLVVDTALFADHPMGNYTGSAREPRELPSGPRKHVVERYQLSDDRTRLLVSEVVEDPDYLETPLTVNTEWDYAPQQPLLRFGCDRRNAQRYLFK
jgi:hypothetical protein